MARPIFQVNLIFSNFLNASQITQRVENVLVSFKAVNENPDSYDEPH
jgi:hypothetical protein